MFDTDYEFVELNRTFHRLSKNSPDSDDIDFSRAFYGVGDSLCWKDLISEYRLIVLSEAGSGKTAEVRNVARILIEQGKSAFFLRLEHISSDFEDAFEVGSFDGFKDWLDSGEEGWLLLDSVDEARLQSPKDFELAIRRLSRRIQSAMARTHIVITSRTEAWRPKTDLAYCTSQLSYSLASTSESDKQVEEDSSEESFQTETKASSKKRSPFKIVALDDLTPDQITVFVKARKIGDSQAFMDEIVRADAWPFTSRPQDLEELTEFWIDNGRIGSRLEIMQNSVDRRLSERDQGRADYRPFSVERARKGARLLAAATTLTQESVIRVPDGANNTKGIAVKSILSDWDDKDQAILLSRPIFDEAIYGTVRFHHRSVREYLTAEWFVELLKRETSRRTIETLFFRNQYGLDIVVPALRPVLPWLAIMDKRIRERIRSVAPEIIFEGGDPSQLPLEVRRYILNEVCKQIADGATDRSMYDFVAVQRFADSDLTDDVRRLIKQYEDNDDLTAFLLRMVWLGPLTGALPEAMKIALTPTAEQYSRITAFRAVRSIGSDEDQEHVRLSFQAETSELKRMWLTELVVGTQPEERTINWLLDCLERSEPKEPYTNDGLEDGVTEFIGAADIGLLPQLVIGLNKLLSLSPMIERRHCEVSERYEWLIAPACNAVERLIQARHSAALELDSLEILHKLSTMRGYGSDNQEEVKADFTRLVPAWPELNRKLFWLEVQRSRENRDKKHAERLTSVWQVSIFGAFWQFEESDFEYVAEEIVHQSLLDNRLVALSLAFNLYKEANRQSAWRIKLEKIVAGNDELTECLNTSLRPPAQDKESRRWKQQENRWKKRREEDQKKKEQYHTDWKTYLKDHLGEEKVALRDKPGVVTNALHYLFEQTRNGRHSSNRWTEYNWKGLISEYGDDIARFYRDGTVSFWRNHEPLLRSEGASLNQTRHAVIIGLAGLEIEAIEIKGWPKNLGKKEAELACRYASFELNGFPAWFPKLFEVFPQTVCDFFIQEVRYELSIEKVDVDSHYIISDLNYSGEWAWNQLASSILDLLRKEPNNLTNLDRLLHILQGSDLPDSLIETLARRKCRTVKKHDHLARWFAVWTSVAADAAITAIRSQITKIADPKSRTLFAMMFVTCLLGGRRRDGTAIRQAFKTPEHLKSLYLLMHEYIRREEDIERAGKGVYSPGLRDDAQDARSNLFSLLNQIPGKEAFLALIEISKVHPEEKSRPWMMHYAKTKAEQDGDSKPWSSIQVRDFNERLERTPSNHKELEELAVLRILDLKDDLEHGDSSIADTLRKVSQETEMRNFICRELRQQAHGRYTIPQEEELADAKRIDLRFNGSGFDGPVPVELKLAEKWTGPHLFERLENQLCGDYLRDNRSNRGVFLLVYRDEKEKSGWDVPNRDSRAGFEELVSALQDHWLQISTKFPNVDDVTVIGIDLTKRSI